MTITVRWIHNISPHPRHPEQEKRNSAIMAKTTRSKHRVALRRSSTDDSTPTNGTSQDCPSRTEAGPTTASVGRWLPSVAEPFGLHAGISCTTCCWATGPRVLHGIRKCEGSRSSAKPPHSNQDIHTLQTGRSLGHEVLPVIQATVRAPHSTYCKQVVILSLPA